VGKFLFQWKARFSDLGKLIGVVFFDVFLTLLLYEKFLSGLKAEILLLERTSSSCYVACFLHSDYSINFL
jgi:hypothetical protein